MNLTKSIELEQYLHERIAYLQIATRLSHQEALLVGALNGFLEAQKMVRENDNPDGFLNELKHKIEDKYHKSRIHSGTIDAFIIGRVCALIHVKAYFFDGVGILPETDSASIILAIEQQRDSIIELLSRDLDAEWKRQ